MQKCKLIGIVILSVILSSCDLAKNDEKSTFFTLKINGEEKVISKLIVANFDKSQNELYFSAGSAVKDWGYVSIYIGNFTGAKTYEAYQGYIGDYINVEVVQLNPLTTTSNAYSDKIKIEIDSYREKVELSGSSSFNLGNDLAVEIEFFIKNVTAKSN